MGLLGRYDAVVDQRTQTVTYDDGTYDFVEVRNADGLIERRPVAATDDEQRTVEIRNLNANRASVEERLAFDGELFPDLLPTARAERIDVRRHGLEAELAVIDERLLALGATTDPKRRRR